MTAEIVSIGTELLLGEIVDTNARALGERFPKWGVHHYHRQTVGDNLERVCEALQLALSRADVVITIGGLGPTEDDLTRQAIAKVMGSSLRRDERLVEQFRAYFEARRLPWVDSIARQADVPDGASAIPNDYGTASGLICPMESGGTIIALPGPRGEFLPMVDGAVQDFFRSRSTGSVLATCTLRIVGMGESQVEHLASDWMTGSNPTVAPYAKIGEVHLRIAASGNSHDEAQALIDPVTRDLRARLGWHVYGIDETTLESACLARLCEKGATLSVAESMTGGGLGARLTSVPGASRAFVGGVVVYTPEVKSAVLGIDPELIAVHGPVSEVTAREMALSSARRLGTDYGLAITGNAGPTSDVDGKPVGLVHIALSKGLETRVESPIFRGLREDIRARAIQAALTMLYRELAK